MRMRLFAWEGKDNLIEDIVKAKILHRFGVVVHVVVGVLEVAHMTHPWCGAYH